MADQHYRVTVGSYDLTLDEIHDPAGQRDIMIVPVIAGAGGGVGKILLGAALIVGAFFTGGATIGLLGLAAPVLVSSVLFKVGALLLLGGVAELLSPVPKVPQGPGSDNDPRKTFNFSGIQQTSKQGVPVPCVYGLTLVGSVVISAGVDTVQVQA
jgi:predicted phage tail protein